MGFFYNRGINKLNIKNINSYKRFTHLLVDLYPYEIDN
jgi:hypothetical protein